ncbi:hypothetical protein [Vibrio salinus]|uniref:hypothetical protein n=1 Tax=Vibrio salinus TaxID=2899784 RepID=UPI001E335765|nr:hypothetical protein [Vibrio salinus]MCE0493727.1 hypothetical protein [Vibrio salinus]
MKNTPSVRVFVPLLVLSLSGCGGGDEVSTGTTSNSSYAYYIDAAVSGISYSCGSLSGTTDSDGKFFFEPGSSCTFSLTYTDSDGNPQSFALKTISADKTAELISGAEYQEKDSTVAQVLQSLDTDSNNNSITISPETVASVINAAKRAAETKGDSLNISSADTFMSAFNTYAAEMEASVDGLDVVTSEEATTHLINTILLDRRLLDVGNASGAIYSTFSFSDSDEDGLADAVSYVDHLGSDDGEASLSFNDSEGTATLTKADNTQYTLRYVYDEDNDIFYLEMTHALASDGSTLTERLYPITEKGAAESYLVSTILSDTTMYRAESGMSSPKTWQSSDAQSVTYNAFVPRVTTVEDTSTTTMFITGFDEDYLTYTYTEVTGDVTTRGRGRMYYDSAKATAYLVSLNTDDTSGSSDSSDATTTAFTLDMVNDKTFYTSDFQELVFSDANTVTVQSTSMLNSEEDGTFSASYSINSSGGLVIGAGNGNAAATLTLTEVGDDYYKVTLTAGRSSRDFTMYTSLDALKNDLVDDALPTSVTDDSDDSTNTNHAGFELLTLKAEELSDDGQKIKITVTANGSITDALATAAVDGGSNRNLFGIEINDSINCGLTVDGSTVSSFCVKGSRNRGRFVTDTSSTISNYTHTEDGKTVTFTIDASVIPSNSFGYLVVEATIGDNFAGFNNFVTFNNANPGNGIYDDIELAANWSADTTTSE